MGLLKRLKVVVRSAMFWVGLYMAIVSLLLLLQAMPFMFPTIFSHSINQNFKIPIDVISWGYMALISMYVGTDRLEKIFSSREIPYGEVFMGDMAKLRRVIVLSLLIFLESLMFSFLYEADFGMSGFFTAFSSTIILYVSGNKLIKTMGNVDGKRVVDNDDNIIKDAQ